MAARGRLMVTFGSECAMRSAFEPPFHGAPATLADSIQQR